MRGRCAGPVLTVLMLAACGPEPVQKPPFARAEESLWRQTNRSHQGSDGIFVQAELRTFAYEIASAYAAAEAESLSQEQLEYRLKQLVHSYVDGSYPLQDGTDINSLFYQYLVYVDPAFDPRNPLQRQVFGAWRNQYVRRVIDGIYNPSLPVLRRRYDDRWGLTLFSRLVAIVYLNAEESALEPAIADIGSRTLLVDPDGDRYTPSGLAGPYPYETDRPAVDVLQDEAVYRVFYPNRRPGTTEAIVTPETRFLELEIHDLGAEKVRTLRWNLPFHYPELPARRLWSERASRR